MAADPPGRDRNGEEELNINFEALASSEAAGCATPDELEALQTHRAVWIDTLRRLLGETEEGLASARRMTGDERDMVVADLSEERDRLREALVRAGGAPPPRRRERPERGPGGRPAGPAEDADVAPTPPLLQASWQGERVVLWAGSRTVPAGGRDDLDALLAEAGAGSVGWESHPGVTAPAAGSSARPAAAVSVPVAGALGWLVGVGSGQLASDASPSLRWLGELAAWATELVAQGRMVPTVTRPAGGGRTGRQSTAEHGVRWVPAAVDRDRLRAFAARMPGAVAVLEPNPAERVCRTVLSAAVDAICREGAARLVTAATSPVARSRAEVGEAILAGLTGKPFVAAVRTASEMADDLERWAAPVTAEGATHLTVRLHAPEDDAGWLLTVEAAGFDRAGRGAQRGQPVPVEEALAGSARARAQVEAQLRRLERLLPPLRRPGGHRGQVVLDGGEAFELMARTGRVLAAAGFSVRVPALASRRPTTRLALHADAFAGPSAVGAQQLSQVRWSVLVDDVELDAAAVARLAKQARPLVKTRGGWVELDRADLDAAAEALREKSRTTQLSGAAILRHAVGLESTTLGGPTVVDGDGWAVDIIRGAASGAATPLPAPDGFVGHLRHYQAEARGWLAFLDRAGLGGCLAMDMGLGKTPTVLAHHLAHRDEGPALVIAPPAVLGNWAREAARFTPDLRVHVHHGADRAAGEDVPDVAGGADVVLTTYATAVRDVEALAGVGWARLVIDEAQAIKNPASDTAQQLRRIPARNRLALTGTPIENGLGDLWSILDFTNPGLVGPRNAFVEALGRTGTGPSANGAVGGNEGALRALNGLLVFRRTKNEPEIAVELPDKIDELDHCSMTPEQVGLYQAVLDRLLATTSSDADDAAERSARKGHVLAAITALKQICDHPVAYLDDDTGPLDGRSGKLTRLEELVEAVFSAGERMLIFTHFARWGERLAGHLTKRFGVPIACYHGGLSRTARDRLVHEFQTGSGPGALVLSIKAGGAGLNLTAASHVVLYDRWWNPAVEDQARDRAWRIGQANTVISHRLVCPGTVDERVEEVVAGKRRIADLVLPASSSLGDLDAEQLRSALGLRPDAIVEDPGESGGEEAAA